MSQREQQQYREWVEYLEGGAVTVEIVSGALEKEIDLVQLHRGAVCSLREKIDNSIASLNDAREKLNGKKVRNSKQLSDNTKRELER